MVSIDLSFRRSRQWVRDCNHLAIVGPTGTGKSWLACALGNKACRDGFSVLYKRASRLFADLAQARGEGRLSRLMTTLERTNLIIIDDWGPEPLTADQRRDLLEIVDDRYDKGSLLIQVRCRCPSGTTLSRIQLSVTRYWTASFTMLTVSNSRATACDAAPVKRKPHEPSHSQLPPPDHTPLPPTLTRRLFPGNYTIVSRARHRVDAQHAKYQC